MSDEEKTETSTAGLGSGEGGLAHNMALDDPGPIEIAVVMKNVTINPTDPMSGRNLHIDEGVDNDAE